MDSDHEHDGLELDPVSNFPVKPKKKRRGGRKKRSPATGFEEYYADAPTTPEEALREQQELYARRIQTCIHRYRTRRRLDTELNSYFTEYMFLGGIDTNGTPFNDADLEEGSLIPRRADDADADAAAASRLYDGHARNWTVDFAGVAAGFLSVSILPLTGVELAPTERAVAVVESFLRYVLQHDVCPEHADDVTGALAVCARARDEWPRVWRLKSLLPGRFNLAAAQTFEVHEATDWSLHSSGGGGGGGGGGGKSLDGDEAPAASPELVFYASLVAAGQPVPKTADGRSDLRLVRRFTCSLALRSVEMPGEDVAGYFGRLALGGGSGGGTGNGSGSEHTHKRLGLQPLGRALFRPTVIEDGWVRQVPLEALPADEDVVFFFERDLLATMTLGMKVTAQVCELSTGFRFVKTLETVQPSFYTFLPQHLLKDYKPPRANDRPPPSIHDGTAPAIEEAPEPDDQGHAE
ncbi:hypothetical protein V2A60_009215 [Cordyceps javanica]